MEVCYFLERMHVFRPQRYSGALGEAKSHLIIYNATCQHTVNSISGNLTFRSLRGPSGELAAPTMVKTR